MSVIASVSLDTEDFTLGAALEENPGIRVHLERVVPVGDYFMPYFWADDDDVDDIVAALRSDSAIESFTIVDDANGSALVRVEWARDCAVFIDALIANGGTMLEGIGHKGRWRFELRFDDHEQLTGFYRACADRDIALELESVHNPGVPRDLKVGFDLTDEQREVLRLALQEGYFDVPRRINLVELAEELGISDSAVSQRLRRATEKVLAATLSHDGDHGGGE